MSSLFLKGCTPWPQAEAEYYRACGYWRGESFSHMLANCASQHGERLALVCGERQWSYSRLLRDAETMARQLVGLGIGPNDRVILQLPNIAEFVLCFFALSRIGALPVMALPAHRHYELGHICRQSQAVAYVFSNLMESETPLALARVLQSEAPSLRHFLAIGETGEFTSLVDLPDETELPPLPSATDVAFFQLSGGTTGIPKLIPRTHDDYLYSVRESAVICQLGVDTVYLCALPMAHNFPMSSPGFLGVFHAGGQVVLAPSPEPAVCFPLLDRYRVTMTALVPSAVQLWLLALDAADVLPPGLSLDLLQVGGAHLPEALARQIPLRFGCRLQQVFGMAEGLVNYTRLDDAPDLIFTTQGRPISPADEVRVVDDAGCDVPDGQPGRLCVRGPYTFRGYYQADEHNRGCFDEQGFYYSGDLVIRLPSGHLQVVGREKDQINRGGEKIAAAEIESLLLAHPQVRQAALVAMPDTLLGEKSCAFIVLHSEPVRPVELRKFLRSKGIADYKLPDHFQFCAELPLTAVGKIDKKQLRQSLNALSGLSA